MPKLFTKPGFQELMEFGKMEKYSAEWQNTEFQFNRGGSWFSKLEIFRLRSFEISRNCRRKYLLKYLAIITYLPFVLESQKYLKKSLVCLLPS